MPEVGCAWVAICCRTVLSTEIPPAHMLHFGCQQLVPIVMHCPVCLMKRISIADVLSREAERTCCMHSVDDLRQCIISCTITILAVCSLTAAQ